MKKKPTSTTLLFIAHLIFVTVLYSSCRKPNLQEEKPNIASATDDTVATILGQKLENPYTLRNMRRAFKKLVTSSDTNNNTLNVVSPVRLTHKYIRFLPKDTIEYDRLVRDTVLKLYNTPLDYEIAKQGNYYHDPTVKNNLYTWLYASVPANYTFVQGIQYQFLDSLYIPEEDLLFNNTTATTATIAQSKTIMGDNGTANVQKLTVTNLLDQAMLQTHNYEYISTPSSKYKTLSSYNPQGNITTYDTRLKKLIPLEGVRIRMKRWFTTRIVDTDADGNYKSATTFRGPVNYYLFFETPRFDVRTGWFVQASIDGPHQREPWNLVINSDDINRFYADVFRGAYRYWYGDIGGLYRPTVITAIKYAARDNNTQTSTSGVTVPGGSVFSIMPQIYISRMVNGRITDSDETFTTTVHETAHYTHYRNMLFVGYYAMSITIQESWATAVELYLTKKEYKARGIANYGDPDYRLVPPTFFPTYLGYQLGKGDVSYSPLFIDLVDNYNQKVLAPFGPINDDITGYNMPDLESYLARVHNEGDLRKELQKNKPTGITESQINNFLSQFKF